VPTFAWIDWAMKQPTRSAVVELATETRSVAIEIIEEDPRTRIGVAPAGPGAGAAAVLMSRPLPAALAPKATMPGWQMPARLGVGTKPPRTHTGEGAAVDPLDPDDQPAAVRRSSAWVAIVLAICAVVAVATYFGLDLLTR
jgi:hypothetical protein